MLELGCIIQALAGAKTASPSRSLRARALLELSTGKLKARMQLWDALLHRPCPDEPICAQMSLSSCKRLSNGKVTLRSAVLSQCRPCWDECIW